MSPLPWPWLVCADQVRIPMIVQPVLPMDGYPGHTTIMRGHDKDAIELLLRLHSSFPDPVVLDCTFGDGVMWKGCNYQPDVKTDIRTLPKLDAVADFWYLPFAANSFEVIVFDPPHIPTEAVTERSSKIWYDRYGITESGAGREGLDVIGLFAPFLTEARRLLVEGGLVLAKMADQVCHHRYHWQQVGFINAVFEAKMTPCDMLIKENSAGHLISSKWKNQMHLRKTHSYWIVVRNSHRCERRRAR